MASPVIDVHTHCLTEAWFSLLQQHGGPRYTVKAVTGGLRAIHLDGAPFMTPVPEMFDWDLRIKNMDRVGIDVSVVSLTCPNVYWGGEAVSLKAAQVMNDEMARARKAWPDRIQWFCSLPWQYEKAALAELKREGLTMLLVEQDIERALELVPDIYMPARVALLPDPACPHRKHAV